jgi:hypothetical protein
MYYMSSEDFMSKLPSNGQVDFKTLTLEHVRDWQCLSFTSDGKLSYGDQVLLFLERDVNVYILAEIRRV